MTISTNASIWFGGAQTDVVTAGGGTSAVASTAFSVSGDAATWINDDDAPFAAFVLKFQYPSGTITAGGIGLYARLLDIIGTNDARQPQATYPHTFLGMFPTGTGMAATTDYYIPLGPLRLPTFMEDGGSQSYEFYVLNNCGVQMSAGWTIEATPLAMGPHA